MCHKVYQFSMSIPCESLRSNLNLLDYPDTHTLLYSKHSWLGSAINITNLHIVKNNHKKLTQHKTDAHDYLETIDLAWRNARYNGGYTKLSGLRNE